MAKLLIADDNIDSALTWQTLLKLDGHDVTAVFGGQGALDHLAASVPEVAVLDVAMPMVSGLDVCRFIRQQPWGKSVLVIALTAYGEPRDKAMTREAGFDAHFVKPLKVEELRKLVPPAERRAAERRRNNRQGRDRRGG